MGIKSAPLWRDLRTLANLITISRVGLILVALPIYLQVSRRYGFVLMAVAGVTDYADGAVARATGTVTRLGEILDQFSDLIYEALLLLMFTVQGFFPAWMLAAYLFREFWVTTIRRFMAGQRLNIPSSPLGKVKTNLIMWGFFPAFLSAERLWPAGDPWMGRLAYGALGAGLVASYASAWGYTQAFVEGYGSAGQDKR